MLVFRVQTSSSDGVWWSENEKWSFLFCAFRSRVSNGGECSLMQMGSTSAKGSIERYMCKVVTHTVHGRGTVNIGETDVDLPFRTIPGIHGKGGRSKLARFAMLHIYKYLIHTRASGSRKRDSQRDSKKNKKQNGSISLFCCKRKSNLQSK